MSQLLFNQYLFYLSNQNTFLQSNLILKLKKIIYIILLFLYITFTILLFNALVNFVFFRLRVHAAIRVSTHVLVMKE